jgi:hypothetical protein
MKYWESAADKLSAAGSGLLQCRYPRRLALDRDAHREGRRYIVHSDELLSAGAQAGRAILNPKHAAIRLDR